jgi:hypothetical protein
MYEVQTSLSMHMALWQHSHPCSLKYGLWLLTPCNGRDNIVARETTSSSKSKTVALWLFTEEICQPMAKGMGHN